MGGTYYCTPYCSLIHTVNIFRRTVRGTILSTAHIKHYTVIHTVNIFRRTVRGTILSTAHIKHYTIITPYCSPEDINGMYYCVVFDMGST
jgi:hypothetical protein